MKFYINSILKKRLSGCGKNMKKKTHKKNYTLTAGYLHPGPEQKGFWAFRLFKTIDRYHAKLYCPTCNRETTHKLHTRWWVCCGNCTTHRKWRFGEQVDLYLGSSIIDQSWFRKIQLAENYRLSKELEELIANKHK